MTSSIIYQQLLFVFFFNSSPSCAFISVPLPHQPKHCAPNRYHHSSTSIGLLRPTFGIDDITDDRHVDIRNALNRMDTLQKHQQNDDDDSGEAIMKDFQKRIKKVVSCRESSIVGAGKGLFATKNIKVGTIIGFYPVHGIGVDFNDDTSSPICLGITPADQEYFDKNENENETKNETSNYIQYLIGSRRVGKSDFGPDAQLFVDINPDRIEKNHHDSDGSINNCWVSHYINDGATVAANSEVGMLDYYSESNSKKNCVHIPFGPSPIIATVTTRQVKKGEELLTSYGCMYWAACIINENEEESIVDITDAVQIQAKQTAQDIFTAWKNSQTTHAGKQIQLQESFEKI